MQQTPTDVHQQLLDTGLDHHRAGRLPQARLAYEQILASAPNDADAMQLLGLKNFNRVILA